MNFFSSIDKSKKTTVVTHSGNFHPDEVFAIAALCLYMKENFAIVRTRDEAMFAAADYLIDVGAENDPARRRFDHHQVGGAGVRANGIPYASFGLVWRQYGAEICGGADAGREIAEIIDRKLVQPTDAIDNGVAIVKPILEKVSLYTVGDAIFSFTPRWDEPEAKFDDRFEQAVLFALDVLKREIAHAHSKYQSQLFVEQAYQGARDKRIIVLDRKYSWRDVLTNYAEPLYVIVPNKETDSWHVNAINERITFTNRKDFPAKWAGKRDAELAAVTGVKDAIFCHNSRFMAVARSREGAIKLAKLAAEA